MTTESVGSLTFRRGPQHLLAQGSRSTNYKGKHNGAEVAIQRIEFGIADVDLSDLNKIGYHHHIVAFICNEMDINFQ